MKTGFDEWIDRRHADDPVGNRALVKRMKIERRMCVKLVTECLKAGYLVSVFDGEVWVVKRSTEREKILMAMFSTDEDRILIRGVADGGDACPVGSFRLIYGNDGTDVISDYTANAECETIWQEVSKLADAIDAGKVRL